MKVAFIGLGIMGSRMAANLLKNNVDLTVYNRTRDKSDDLQRNGAKVAMSLAESVIDADVVITMLSSPEVVEEMALGENGFVQSMKGKSLWVDCSTVSPHTSRNFAAQSKGYNVRFLEAPVAGTKQPAENGELVFFVGGDKDDMEIISKLLEYMGKKTVHMGAHGNGASIKLLINLMLAQSMLAFSEAVGFGKKMGLDVSLVHKVLSASPVAAPFLANVVPKLKSGDQSANFPMQWMHKDLHLIADTAYKVGANLPSAGLAKDLYGLASASGLKESDFTSVYHYLIPE